MKFRYKGAEPTVVFGFDWVRGTEHEVTDAHAIGKLSNHPMFDRVDDKAPKPEPPKPPDAPKAKA